MKLTDEQREQRNRLKAWMKLENIGRESLANRIGYQKKYIDQVLSGGNAVSKALLYEISKYYNVDTEWVLNGEGEMFVDTTPKKNEASKVEEPDSEYVADPLSALRRLVDDYRETKRQVDALAAELSRLKAAVRELEERLN